MNTKWLPHLMMGLALIGCAAEVDPVEAFDQALRAGAPCSRLFDLRNEIDPDYPAMGILNAKLRNVGCHSSTSTRTD